ncbi:thrombomodulin-like [Amia ocellicauda]|uniref:thrombomodulin-like n=1 Tax=Amia ocellicauda TaxID=2972642 RepID=UPI003463FB99
MSWKSLFFLIGLNLLLITEGQSPKSTLCVEKDCYSSIEDSTDFQTAQDTCSRQNGHLMTVRSSVSNDAISVLISHLKGVFWIGLQLPHGHCTDNTAKLRGYKWTTGDENTDFTNWRDMGSSCSQLCVSVSRDLKWTERPCQEKVDGFLCEYNFNKTCKPLPQVEGESVQYITPLGFTATDLTSIPPGTIVVFNPSEVKAYCADDWIQGPWDCQVENGGCEHQCQMNNSKPQCFCPPGEELKDNKVTCEKMNPCFNSGCEHLCVPHDDGFTCMCHHGFDLQEDVKRCRDIDDCKLQGVCGPNEVCVNTIGSFQCNCTAGFKKSDDKCTDINECSNNPCDQECVNTPGSYKCTCYEGYVQSSEDHTKCLLHCPTAECLAECDLNTPWQCNCPEGYVIDERGLEYYCVDVDECDSGTYCAQLCNNTWGSFICHCEQGFYLRNQFDCEPEDAEQGSGMTILPPLMSSFVTPKTTDSDVTIELIPYRVIFGAVVFMSLMSLGIVVICACCCLKQSKKINVSPII